MSRQATEQLFAGKFRLVKMLGRGAMGEVWLAEEVGPRGFSRQVAVKRLLATEGISDYARESFLAEAQVIARLDHPNIVHLIELGESDDRGLYLVLDYIDGAALDRVLRKGGALSAGSVAFIGREVAKALDAVHSMTDPTGRNLGVVHRDVSPANILIGRDGRVRLSDFGVARIHGLGGEKTETGVFKGKLPYMPPEQALGEPFDGRADIFSLGITLYEALLGGRLRKAETQGQLIAMIATERVARVHQTIPTAMPDLAMAIDMATEFKSISRTAGAGQLAAQLHNVLYALGPSSEEAALREICERVAMTSGGPVQQPRQPWSIALRNETSSSTSGPLATPAGPESVATRSEVGAQSRPASLPPDAPVTNVASIADPPPHAPSATGRTWLFALLAAVIVGAGFGAAWAMLSPAASRDGSAAAATGPASGTESTSTIAAVAAAAATTESSPIPESTPPEVSGSEAPRAIASASAPRSGAVAPGPVGRVPVAPGTGTAAVAEVGEGSLVVTVNPWGFVTVDGQSKGMTPIGAIKLPSGTHTVAVTNPELGASRVMTVKIAPGKTTSVRFDLKKTGN